MKKKILYTCEICRTDYADEKEAKKCESTHQEFKVLDSRYRPREPFPTSITVCLRNGLTATYKR